MTLQQAIQEAHKRQSDLVDNRGGRWPMYVLRPVPQAGDAPLDEAGYEVWDNLPPAALYQRIGKLDENGSWHSEPALLMSRAAHRRTALREAAMLITNSLAGGWNLECRYLPEDALRIEDALQKLAERLWTQATKDEGRTS